MHRPKRKQSSRSSGPTVGKLPRRYTFMLNPFPEARLSSCPGCRKLTYPRKFPLFIHVEGWGPITQGKTCKYCSRCELIMCDQAELEAQLAHSFERLKPEVIGNDYLVVGTVETKTWKRGMGERPPSLEETLQHTADFKGYSDLLYDPGGWRREGSGPHYLEPTPPGSPWRRAGSARRTSMR
jgi:hypothetical protein